MEQLEPKRERELQREGQRKERKGTAERWSSGLKGSKKAKDDKISMGSTTP